MRARPTRIDAMISLLALLVIARTPSAFVNFTSPETVVNQAGATPRVIAIADFDGDSYTDVAYCSFGAGYGLEVLYASEFGMFLSSPTVVSTSDPAVLSIWAGDVTGDGRPDILLASQNGNVRLYIKETANREFVLNPISGSMSAPVYSLAVARYNSRYFVFAVDTTGLVAWFDVSSLSVRNSIGTPPGSTEAKALAVGDVDQDGSVDVVVGLTGVGTVGWFRNRVTSPATFAAFQLITGTFTKPRSVAVADVDSDGRSDDVVAAGELSGVAWFFFNAGGFVLGGSFTTSNTQQLVVVPADLDGDNDIDLLVAGTGVRALTFFVNDGRGVFSSANAVTTLASGVLWAAVGDMNNDGFVDVVRTSLSGTAVADMAWYRASRFCPALSGPAAVGVNVTGVSPFNAYQAVGVACVLPLVLVGSPVSVCRADGSLVPPIGTCVAPPPPPPPSPPPPPPPPPCLPALENTLAFGAVACTTGNAAGSVCIFTCNVGFTRFGPMSRNCTNSTWTPSAAPVCSAAVAAQSGAIGANTTVAGTPVLFTCFARTAGLLPVTTGADEFEIGALEYTRDRTQASPWASIALAASAVQSEFITGSGNYTLGVTFTLAGLYRFSVLLNGVPVGVGGPILRTVDVRPAVAVGASSLAEGPGLTSATLNAISLFTIVARDVYANEVGVGGATVVASLKPISTAAQPLAVTDLGNGEYAGSYRAVRGGLHTLSMSLDGGAIADSPFSLFVSSACPPGTFAGDVTTGECIPCIASTFSAVADSAECTPCGLSMTSPAGASSQRNCSCLDGTFASAASLADATAVLTCAPCPTGARCAGGYTSPIPLPGYVAGDSPDAIIACPNQRACAGGAGSPCAAGYSGSLCAACADGYYQLGSQCRRCRSNGAVVGLVLLMLFAAIVVAGALVIANLQNRSIFGASSLLIGLNSLQVIALYGTLELGWPDLAQEVFSVVSLANLNIELTSPECSFLVRDPWALKYALTMLLPVFAAAVLALVCVLFVVPLRVVARLRARWPGVTSAALRSAGVRSFVQAVSLLYLPLAAATLQYFACVRVDTGALVMTGNLSRSCYTRGYWMLLPVVLVFVALYAIGIPLALVRLLVRTRVSSGYMVVSVRYGFLVGRFTPENYLYEVAVMVRKLCVVLAITVARETSIGALLLTFTLVAAAFIGIRRMPYLARRHSYLDVFEMAAAAVVVSSARIDKSSHARNGFILTALFAALAAIVASIVLDVYLLVRDRRRARAAFAQVPGATANCDDDDDGGGKRAQSFGSCLSSDFGEVSSSVQLATISSQPCVETPFSLSLYGSDVMPMPPPPPPIPSASAL